LNFLKNAAVLEGKPELAHIAKHKVLAVVDLVGRPEPKQRDGL
jgi:hypothetical protein